MIRINNVAEFKRAMTVGSKWSFTDSRHVGETIRECTNSQSKSFALNNHPNAKNKSDGSWLDYPKAKEVTFIQEEGQSTRVRINLTDDGSVYLIYQPTT